MKYLLTIYADEKAHAQMSQEAFQSEMEHYLSFNKEVRERSILIDGEALQPTNTATTVQVRDGKTLTTDGPFAETREQLGGYYILDCKDLDEAIEWATKIPGSWTGSVEIRPVVVWQ